MITAALLNAGSIATFRATGERVTKIRDRAANALDLLRVSQSMFDVIYLDAGKGRDWVFCTDSAGLAVASQRWHLDLGRSQVGVRQAEQGPAGRCNPPGTMQSYSSCLDILHEDRQLIARKTQDWPNTIVSRRWPAP